MDHLNDWSHTYSHSSSLTFGVNSAQYFGGDTSRVTRTTTGSAEVVWHVPDLISAFVTVYFWPNATLAPFTFATSADEGATWQAATPLIDAVGSNWLEYTYLLTGSGSADYLKVVFPAISPEYAAQISSVQFVVP
jgi:glucuronoarabinoxylan endo-1,4-beta-xylanase